MAGWCVILLVVALMLAAGLLGGFANYVSADPAADPKKSEGRRLLESLVLGLVAALITPLFLSLARSSLLSDIVTRLDAGAAPTSDLAVFFGFCLIAAFSSRVFLGNVSERVLALTREVRKLDEKTDELSETQDEIAENLVPEAQDEAAKADRGPVPEGGLPRLDPEERTIAQALVGRGYTWRSASGVAGDTGLPRDRLLSALARLEGEGVVESKISRKGGHPLFKLTGLGWRALHA